MIPRPTIALDAMGGDAAPNIVVEGAALARDRFPDVKFIMFGDEKQISPLVEQYENLKGSVSIYHTDDAVSSEERPAVALRQG